MSSRISKRIDSYFGDCIRGRWRRNGVENYSTDQSVFRRTPMVVVVPHDIDDVAKILRFAREENLPVTPRAGGSSTGGAAVGPGISVDMRGEEFSHVRSMSDGTVAAGPGVRHDVVQKALGERGYYLPSDPSSGPLSFLGGNIATKASGPHALQHGAIDRFLTDVELMLPGGDLVTSLDEVPRLATAVHALGEGKAIRKRLKGHGLEKIACGYNLAATLSATDSTSQLASLVAGSAGTLGIVTQATLRGIPLQSERALGVVAFPGSLHACEAVASLRRANPAAIELLDEKCTALMPSGTVSGHANIPSGAVLVIEIEGNHAYERLKEATAASDGRVSALWNTERHSAEIRRFWKGRKQMLFRVRERAGGTGAPSLVNDVGVAVRNLPRFVADLSRLLAGYTMAYYIYGHAGSGNLHLRPDVRTLSPAEQVAMARSVYELVLAYDGTVTAEHGMGRLRAPWLRREWGPDVYESMRSIKGIADPSGIMNPDVMFSDRSFEEMMQTADLR